MNIVVAIDSFKGSLSSLEAGAIVREAARKVLGEEAAVKVFPLADGGEGTVEALTAGLGGSLEKVQVTGPLGHPIQSRYGKTASGMAIIEMADAAGLTLVPKEQLNPLKTTTYGLGELILHAARSGCRDFIIGIGGSATNDCGLGMLTALGAKFLQKDGAAASVTGSGLAEVASMEIASMDPILRECRFHIACDVTNPLCGPEGCSYVYGPQKGATPDIAKKMDEDMAAFAGIAREQLGITGADMPGAGAAGGLGFAFHAFLGGTLEPGIRLVLDTLGLEEHLASADLAITGEGCLDEQTAMGKAPLGVAQLAKKARPEICTIALCGCAKAGAAAVNAKGIDAYFPILHLPMQAAEAMEKETASQNLRQTAEQVFRLWALGR